MATSDWFDTASTVAAGNFSTTNTKSVGITTANANEVLVVCLGAEQSNALTGGVDISVTSLTDTAGLTWTKRKAITFQGSDTRRNALEMWWAKKPTAGATTVTITLNVNIDCACFAVAAFKNLPNPDAPWDTDASLPGTYTNVTGSAATPTATISTAVKPLVLALGGSINDRPGVTGYTVAITEQNTAGSLADRMKLSINEFASALSSQAVTADRSVVNVGWIVDAMAIAVAAPATGTVTAVMN